MLLPALPVLEPEDRRLLLPPLLLPLLEPRVDEMEEPEEPEEPADKLLLPLLPVEEDAADELLVCASMCTLQLSRRKQSTKAKRERRRDAMMDMEEKREDERQTRIRV